MKKSPIIPSLQLEDGELVESDSSKASVFAKQYDSVYTAESTTPPKLEPHGAELSDVDISSDKVQKLLENVDTNSSPGPDGLHPALLRALSNVIHKPLSELFRQSLEAGTLPSGWKEGVIKPLHKGGRTNDPKNYRPVTLTSIVGKIMEKLVKETLELFLMQSGQQTARQHGFTAKRSCMSNLVTAREHWVRQLDAGLPVDVIFIDFSKAFDRVPHQRLLCKLRSMGVTGNLMKWIENFLCGRVTRVEVNGVQSTPSCPTSGVPQGSVLGPSLFKIFVNDLPSALDADCLLFADDLKIWAAVDRGPDLQHELDKLVSWTKLWLLPVNKEKCATLHLGANNPRLTYNIDGEPVKSVDSEKDLGLIISSSLESKADTERKLGAATRMWWSISRSFAAISPTMFKILYASYVRPILEYGLPVSYPLTKGEKVRLENLQRRATKRVHGLRNLSYEDRLQRLDLFPLEFRRIRFDLLVARRIILGSYGQDISGFFPTAEDSRTRGHGFKLAKRRTLRFDSRFTLSTRIVNLWNALPPEMIAIQSEEEFKRVLDRQLPDILDRCCPNN